MKISKEYEKFLEGTIQKERRKFLGAIGCLYEDFCNIFGFLKISVPDEKTNQNLKKAIDFSNMNITSEMVFSSTIFIIALTIVISVIGLLLYLPVVTALGILISGICFSIWFLYYPIIFARNMMIKESAESILTILYMVISLKSVSNLENAVKFSAQNLQGPLGLDLKRLLWDVYIGKYTNVTDALTEYSKKWKFENKQFTESLDLIISSIGTDPSRKDKMLDQALDTILGGTEEKMKHYGEELKMPVMLLNTLGILLPLVGMTLFPIIVIFMTESVKPLSIVVIYNIILPIVIYALIKTVLHKRPWTFTQPNVSEHPEAVPLGSFKIGNTLLPILPLAFLIGFLISSIGAIGYFFYPAEVNSFTNVIYSMFVFWGVAIGLSFYFLGSSYQNLKIIEDTKTIESELEIVLFKLGNELYKGEPIETAINASVREKEFKSTSLFQRISQNIKMLGMTLENAILNPDYGAIRYFPSALTKSIMRVVSETSKKGLMILSSTLITISTYLKKIHGVEEKLKELLEESTSEMNFQAVGLTPIVSAIVLALVFIVISYLTIIQDLFKTLEIGGTKDIVDFSIKLFTDVNNVIPMEILQLVIGFYMIEAVWLITLFRSAIEFGEEKITTNYYLGKSMLMATIVYSLVFIMTALALQGVMSLLTI